MRYSLLSLLSASIVFFSSSVLSCAQPKPSTVAGIGVDGSAFQIQALDDASIAGELSGIGEGKLRFACPNQQRMPTAGALELEYEVDAEALAAAASTIVFESDSGPSWALPPDAAFLGFPSGHKRLVRYRFPASAKTLSTFTLAQKKAKYSAAPKTSGPVTTVFKLRSVSVAERCFGFDLSGSSIFLTPFVYREAVGEGIRFSIDPPPEYKAKEPIGVKIAAGAAAGKLSSSTEEYRYAGRPDATDGALLTFASGTLPENPLPLAYEAKTAPRLFLAEAERRPAFPEEPITADPGLILSYRREAWRDARYEVFRWERFPSLLIFDTADYAVQERLFKRLAFFVEKAGFRGHLATDADIAALHGWNAHDYRAEDLAAFFEAARKTKFPLNAEETELRRILLASGLIRKAASAEGFITSGEGAIISISRESVDYLRTLFITHEGFHGIFFQDKEFRAFSSERYAALPPEPKKFLKAYFDSRRYDVRDAYLMTNELMAYCLQQPVDLVPKYFGDTLPVRLEKDEWRKRTLPPKQEGEIPYPTLAEAFRITAAEFDSYTSSRWGVRAGRLALVYQISRTKAAR